MRFRDVEGVGGEGEGCLLSMLSMLRGTLCRQQAAGLRDPPVPDGDYSGMYHAAPAALGCTEVLSCPDVLLLNRLGVDVAGVVEGRAGLRGAPAVLSVCTPDLVNVFGGWRPPCPPLCAGSSPYLPQFFCRIGNGPFLSGLPLFLLLSPATALPL